MWSHRKVCEVGVHFTVRIEVFFLYCFVVFPSALVWPPCSHTLNNGFVVFLTNDSEYIVVPLEYVTTIKVHYYCRHRSPWYRFGFKGFKITDKPVISAISIVTTGWVRILRTIRIN